VFDFETRFWITVGPAVASIAVGLVAGVAFSQPLVIVAAAFLAGGWAALAYVTCTALDYGIGDAPEYEPDLDSDSEADRDSRSDGE